MPLKVNNQYSLGILGGVSIGTGLLHFDLLAPLIHSINITFATMSLKIFTAYEVLC